MLFRDAIPEDDEQLTRLIANPMPGDLSLSFRREPSLLRACAECGPRRKVLTAATGRKVVALCTYFSRQLKVGETYRPVWTISDFRAERRAAHRSITGRGWRALRERLEGRPALISVVDDNPVSLRLFSKARRGWPRLHRVAGLKTRLVPLWAVPEQKAAGGLVRPSVSQLVEYLGEDSRFLSPGISSEDVGSVIPCSSEFVAVHDGCAPRACGALWDLSSHRQVAVADYGGFYRRFRRLLPLPGTPVRVCFAAFLRGECEPSRDRIFRELVRRAKERGATFLVLGQDGAASSPIPSMWPRLVYRSALYQLVWEGEEILCPGNGECGYEVAWL